MGEPLRVPQHLTGEAMGEPLQVPGHVTGGTPVSAPTCDPGKGAMEEPLRVPQYMTWGGGTAASSVISGLLFSMWGMG